jgi:hypothetical protein
MIAIVSLLIAVALSLLITRVASVALTLTGMAKDAARFQARSAFTGVGFTSRETEQIVSHPVRRRIVMILMLLGNAGLVTVISSLVISFGGAEQTGSPLIRLGLLIGGLTLLWVVAVSRWVDRRLSSIIKWALRKWTDIDVRDYANLLHLSAGFGVAEAKLSPGHWMTGKTLTELDLKEYGILILGIQRASGEYEGAPHGETRIEVGDTLVVYGRGKEVVSVLRPERQASKNELKAEELNRQGSEFEGKKGRGYEKEG